MAEVLTLLISLLSPLFPFFLSFNRSYSPTLPFLFLRLPLFQFLSHFLRIVSPMHAFSLNLHLMESPSSFVNFLSLLPFSLSSLHSTTSPFLLSPSFLIFPLTYTPNYSPLPFLSVFPLSSPQLLPFSLPPFLPFLSDNLLYWDITRGKKRDSCDVPASRGLTSPEHEHGGQPAAATCDREGTVLMRGWA